MRFFALSDIGKVRRENQDTWQAYYDPGRNAAALAVCDGMGGAAAGQLASTLAAENFISHLRDCIAGIHLPPTDEMLHDAAAYANLRLYDRAFRNPELYGMGTTLVGAIVLGKSVSVVNVGDSRAYMWSRDAGLQKITNDHSFVAEMLARGRITPEQAKNHPKRNIITRALGVDAEIRSDVFHPVYSEEARFLFCTDGLSNLLEDEEISALLSGKEEPEPCCRALMELALERSAPDNVTAAVLFTD